MIIKKNLKEIPIEEFTSVDPITINEFDSVEKAMQVMEENGIRHMPVVNDEGNCVGLVSQREIYSRECNRCDPVKTVMIEDPYTVYSNELLRDVVFKMSEKKYGSALVQDGEGKLFGVFTSIDALNAIIEYTD